MPIEYGRMSEYTEMRKASFGIYNINHIPSIIRTFNETNHYQFEHIGPIDVDTILKLDAANGKVLNSWGASLFYFPHGMTIDHDGFIWITDVALHQVFKFKPKSRFPLITIGRRFQPDSIPRRVQPGSIPLCKPTAVSVASSGEVCIIECGSVHLKFAAFLNVFFHMPFRFLLPMAIVIIAF